MSVHLNLRRLSAAFACACILSASLPTLAQEAEPTAAGRMRLLIDQGAFQQAYAMAQEVLFENEGDPEFDFYYGLAALESGRPDEAVFAFERVAFAFPEQRRVKLELARAYYMSNNLAASADLFGEVLETNPEPNVASNINAFLAAIEERRNTVRSSLRWFVNSNVGSDSNINSATELGVISTPIGDVELNPNGQSIDDLYMELGGGFVYTRPLDKNRSLGLSGAYNKHNNLDSDHFDLDTLVLEGSYALIRDNNRFGAATRYQRVLLAEEGFQSSGSLMGTWQRNARDGWSQSFTGALTTVRYDTSPASPNADLRDVNQMLVSGAVSKASGAFLHSVSLYYGDETSLREQGRNNAQRFYGLAFSEQFRFRPEHLPYLRLSLHRSDNKRSDPVFNVERQDETFSATVGWMWRLGDSLNLNSDVTFTDNESNIDLYQYDRLKYQTGFRYSF